MNKTEMNAKLKKIDLQEYGKELGNSWMQEHAKIVESYMNEPVEDLVPSVLYGLQDLQVRDYALGLLYKSNLLHKIALEKLVNLSPAKYSHPATTMLAIWFWENGNVAKTSQLLAKCTGYPLASLITRCIFAGWEPTEMSKMRLELHQSVVDNIFNQMVSA